MDPSSLDWQTRAINAVVDHWPLVVALLAFAKWGFPYAMREHGHLALSSVKGQEAQKANITAYFNNGGGDKIKSIVREENAMQTEVNKNETRVIVSLAIKEHEAVEARKMREELDEFKRDITDEFDLQPKAPRARPRHKGAR